MLMSSSYFAIFIPVISLIVNILCQIIYYKCLPKPGLLNSIFKGFVFGLFTFLLFELCQFQSAVCPLLKKIDILIVHLITYACLSYCYFHFINLGETARRIRILRELEIVPEGLSLHDILTRYNANEIIERRLTRLIKDGQLILAGDKYRIGKPVMLLISKLLAFAKVLFLGKSF
ncbi:MAG: hypothetical protein ABH843_02780 [Candidatus Omnitrophota bacterium]